jgi:hypothetical protein
VICVVVTVVLISIGRLLGSMISFVLWIVWCNPVFGVFFGNRNKSS